MKKDKEKAMYESPVTKETRVNLESGICAASAIVENPNDSSTGQIDGHDVNDEFGGSWSNGAWDSVN